MQVENIEEITVLGAGAMGHGIAEVAALVGYTVTLRDLDEDLVQQGYENIRWSLKKLVERGHLTENEKKETLTRVEPVVEVSEAVSESDIVIEAVPERMEIKKQVFQEVLNLAPDRTLFTTNTSTLSITKLSEATDRPSQFCGMHFFNPPVQMELVEVITGAHTTVNTIETIEALAEEFGKTPIRVRNDSPGFIVNRVLVPMLNEACWTVSTDEATITEIDAAVTKQLDLPMGIFELTDQVGIDVVYDILTYMHEQLGDAYVPCPLLEEKIKRDELGHKTDHGFYDYENDGEDHVSATGDEMVAHRIAAVMTNEVAKLLEADVAPLEDIDRALQLGAGFPRGPAEIADSIGLETLLQTLETRQSETNAERYVVAQLLRERTQGNGFHTAME